MQTDPISLNKKLVRQHFDRHAFEYDRYAVVQKAMALQLMEMLEQYSPQKQYKRILEIGCGTGNLTEMLQKQWSSAHITAVDISEAMISQTRLKLGDRAKGIHFITEDVEGLDTSGLLKGDYDLIISNATFQWFQQPASTIKGLLAYLQASKGSFAFSTFGPRTFYELHHSFQTAEMMLGLKAASHGQTFGSEAFWRSLFLNDSSKSPIFNWQQREQIIFHPSVREFLNSIKRVGAGNATQSTESQPQMRQLFKQMETCYLQHYSSPSGIQATYDLSFGLFSA